MGLTTDKTRPYCYLLIALLSIMIALPCIEAGNNMRNNIAMSVFFMLFLLASLKVANAKGIAPKKRIYRLAIHGTIIISFLADFGELALYTISGHGEKMKLGMEHLFQLSGMALYARISSLITTTGYTFITVFLIILIIRDIFSGGPVKSNKIFGAVVAYILLGISWAMLYTIFELVQPGSLIQANGGHINSFAQAVYFSFTTLCTVGYGDITPQAHLAMVFANLEAITGQLYLAILVARLVTLYTAHNANKEII